MAEIEKAENPPELVDSDDEEDTPPEHIEDRIDDDPD